jgi:hypothetical protein
MAWDVNKWNLQTLPDYLGSFAAEQFGPAHAREIAGIMDGYYRLGYQRKPEHTQWSGLGQPPRPSGFSYEDGSNEGLERLRLYNGLAGRARQLEASIPPADRDAFYELVEYPAAGSAAANQRFIAREMAELEDGRRGPGVGRWVGAFDAGTADLVAAVDRYNGDVAGGKWKGYIEDDPLLPSRSYRNAILRLPADLEQMAPAANSGIPAIFGGLSGPVLPGVATEGGSSGRFVESDGVVSILAEHYSRKTDRTGAAWRVIPGLGRTGNAVAIFPTTAPSVDPARAASDAPVLQYDFNLSQAGEASIHFNLIPAQPLNYGTGLRFAVAVDGDAPRLVTLSAGVGAEVGSSPAWQENVLDNTTATAIARSFATPGAHTLRIYMVDPGVLLEKIVIDMRGLRPSYLGPPETLASAN